MNVKLGRNDPCFCGSGKKFKKCCYGKNVPSEDRSRKSDILPAWQDIDYGVPRLNEDFFEHHRLHDISAAKMLHMRLTAPEAVEACAGFVRLKTTRHIEEAKEINSIASSEVLMKILKRGPDHLNVTLIRKKFLVYRESMIPMLLQELKFTQDDSFAELAVDLLHVSKQDCSSEVIELIERYQRDGYIVSMLCLLLGFYDHPKIPKLLWDYYHYFKAYFPTETYSDGPLLAIYEIDERSQ